MTKKKVNSAKISVVCALVLILGYAGFLLNQQWVKRKAVEQEISVLQQQARTLTGDNEALNQTLSYLDSTAFKEKVARLDLNFKEKDEIVISYPPENTSSPERVGDINNQSATSNAVKWWFYFFKS